MSEFTKKKHVSRSNSFLHLFVSVIIMIAKKTVNKKIIHVICFSVTIYNRTLSKLYSTDMKDNILTNFIIKKKILNKIYEVIQVESYRIRPPIQKKI